jgi:drug/metabolite transporter (DMT)-like permease
MLEPAGRIAGLRDAADLRGRCYAIAAGVCFGTLGIFSRLYYDHGGDPFSLLIFRTAGGGVGLVLISLARRPKMPPRRLTVLASILGISQLAASACLLLGFEHASPGLVELLFYVYPLIVTVLASLFLEEEMGPRKLALLLVGIAGIALTVGGPGAPTAVGIAFGLGAGVFTAIYIIGARYVMTSGMTPTVFLANGWGMATIAVAVAAAVHSPVAPNSGNVVYLAGVILIATIAAALLFYSAVGMTSAGTAARLGTVEPLVTVLLAYIVLDQPVTALQLVGGALIVVSVAALATIRR